MSQSNYYDPPDGPSSTAPSLFSKSPSALITGHSLKRGMRLHHRLSK